MAGWCVLKANRDTMLVNQNKSNVKQDNAVPVSVTMAGSIVATTTTITTTTVTVITQAAHVRATAAAGSLFLATTTTTEGMYLTAATGMTVGIALTSTAHGSGGGDRRRVSDGHEGGSYNFWKNYRIDKRCNDNGKPACCPK